MSALHVKTEQNQAKERHYYIAAEEIDWSYYGNGTNRFNPIYKKVVFREYDKDFRKAKPHPSWLGLLGPTLRAEEGETIVVTFRNRANALYSLHSHGVNYGKQSEGANYFDNTSLKEKDDDLVYPNQEHVYYWEVTSKVSPQPDDPNCLTYTYFSHKNVVEDFNSGLIGTLLICKPGSLDESGKQVGVHKEYTLLFGVFDEKQSIYDPRGFSTDNHVMYTINGYAEGALPGECLSFFLYVHFCAHAPVSLHLVGMSSNPEVFSVHINGQVLTQDGHKVSSVGLISGSSATVSLVAPYAGRWLLSSQNMRHIEAGLHGFVDIKKCEEFKEPKRTMTIAQKRQSTEWKYYIAAEEVVWDYSPDMQEHVDEDFKRQYLTQSSTRIGAKYKKAVYTLYKNESFTERLENAQIKNELGILGPVIRAQIRDVIKVIFKNMASRPYSIYPHGLMIEKSEEGVYYPKGGNHSHMVKPGETHTYVWKVLEENEPLDADSRCLTRMYHSAVDTPRDIASGLIGPILICKSQSLNVRNVADKEQQAVFAMFDENKSWYLDDNIRLYSDVSKVNKADRDFYDSNVMHTINGYAFESGPVLGFCNGEVATWHVSSIGAQNHIQTATFYGHPFELNGRTEDFLSLYPMTGETITMSMDNIGESQCLAFELSGPNTKTYFIAAEEVEWDYAGQGQSKHGTDTWFCYLYRRPEKNQLYGPETKFTKVIFRGYLDSDFSTPDIRGELDEHLGILGPVIKAEVGQTIMVVFRNRANRPYSIHPNGYDNEVLPNTTFTYIWKASTDAGPGPEDSNCRTWAYYSGVNPEKDIHSGLIGPLLVCREGTLDKQEDSREFTLLFMTFDESQSWYYNQNFELLQRKSRRRFLDASLKENLKFHSINGIIFNLKGLRMYTDQLVYWHLLNMGSSKDFQSVHFHGQTFITKKTKSYRQAVYPLLPGSFATLEMYPSKPGLWQLETEIGLIQQKGMQTLFLVLDNGA
uniref:Coagulation factor V n=1 Tax=Oryzias sinensis TaxID=183150 RepID=A0A8C8DPK6_9TELE